MTLVVLPLRLLLPTVVPTLSKQILLALATGGLGLIGALSFLFSLRALGGIDPRDREQLRTVRMPGKRWVLLLLADEVATRQAALYPVVSALQRLRRWLDRNARLALWILLGGWWLVMSVAAVRKFQLYGMGFDLGLIQQAVWNTVHGRPFATQAYDFTNNLLGTDSFFVLLLFVPFYAVLPNPATLLVVQTVIVGSGAIALYLLTTKILGKRWPGPVVALLYLGYLPVINGDLYEVRERIMAMAFVLWLLWCLYERRYRLALVPLVLALSCRLDSTIGVALVGVYALLLRHPWRVGLGIIFAAAGWYLVVTKLIIPVFTTQTNYIFLEHYSDFGHSASEIVVNVVIHPLHTLGYVLTAGKLWYLVGMFLPLLFLPLGDWRSLLVMAPLFGLNLLANRRIQWDIYHHYQGLIVPFMFTGALHTLARLRRAWRWTWDPQGALIGGCVAVTLLAPLLFGSQFPGLLRAKQARQVKAANELVREVPADVPLAVGNLLAPHVAPRQGLFLVPGNDFHYAADPFGRADYALLDLGKTDVRADYMMVVANWCVVDQRSEIILARRQPNGNGARCAQQAN
ncbi:MAG: hypothetical protein NVS4B8_13220 [Herpetosiphon sp.]